MKKCNNCLIEKPLTDYHQDKSNKTFGVQSQCKVCRKNFNIKNRDKITAARKSFYEENRQRLLTKKKENYNIDKEKFLQRNAQYYEQHKIQINKNRLKYQQDRLDNDLNFRLRKGLRSRLCAAVSKEYKSGSAINDLGCSIEQLKVYLQKQFKLGMNWENYGRNGWHIDHIIPLSSFDLTIREQFLKACHYSNLQPLWWEENLSKGNKHG